MELICEIFRVCEKQLDSTLELLAGQLEVLTNLVETPADSIKKQQSICIVLRVMMYSFAYYWMGKSNTDGESLPMLSLPLYSSNLIGPLGSENAKSPTSARSQNLPALPTLSASSKVFGATKKLAELPPLASLKADAVIQAIQVHLADIDASIESLPYSWNTDAIQHSLFRERHIYFYRTAFANKTLKSVAFLVFEHINDHKPTLNKMIETAAARNLFFMSTSNWQTVFNYIQTHLVGWMKVEKTKVAQNSIQNQAVFYSYLEGCNINQERLVDILEDAQKLISMDLTDQAQGEMALVLANVIRSWILDYPDQFHGLWKTKLNILSSMDKLLDYFNECLESKKKKTIFIPLISGLFLISPADTMEITLAAGGSSKKKKHPYTTIYELLRRPGKGKFGFDVSFYCHIDLLRATLATVDNNAITWVNTFFSDLLDASLKEVKEKIFDVTKPVLSSKDEETFITERNIQMYICYLLEFDQTARAMLVRVLDNTYPASFKSLVINGMLNVWLRVGQISVKLRDSKFDRLAFVSMRTLFSVSLH